MIRPESWQVTRVTPGSAVDSPTGVRSLSAGDWVDAVVPGSLGAGETGQRWGRDSVARADDDAWWFRAAFTSSGDDDLDLVWDRVATYARFFVDGRSVGSSDSAFRTYRVPVDIPPGHHELLLRIAPLHETPVPRTPRERWRSSLVPDRSLRRRRTPLLGRFPTWAGAAPPVGILGSCKIHRRGLGSVRRLTARLDEHVGRVDLDVVDPRETLTFFVDGTRVVPDRTAGPDGADRATLVIPGARLWWPHTHGEPTTYRIEVRDGDDVVLSRDIGFRTVEVDRREGRFGLRVNGVEVFVRGACWVPPDPWGWTPAVDAVVDDLAALAAAGLNLVRVTGTGTYECDAFWDATGRAGFLVWQDVMLGTFDPPSDAAWLADFADELGDRLSPLQGRPGLVVVCGGSETEQQPTLLGRSRDESRMPAIHEVVPRAVADILPGVVHVESSPSGGPLPISIDEGVSHYFGVGAYRRGLDDARSARVSFASESLAFSTPAERADLEASFGSGDAAHLDDDPAWRRGVPADRGVDWDFQDVTRHYVDLLFPRAAAAADADRLLDLQRAAVTHAMTASMAAWRSGETPTRGAVVLSHRDLARGPGWGLLDHRGAPKAPLLALRDVCAPVALLLLDLGLDGPVAWAVNDSERSVTGRLALRAYGRGDLPAQEAHLPLEVPARAARRVHAQAALGGFRDLTWAWRFGEPTYRFLRATWTMPGTPEPIADTTMLLGPLDRLVAPQPTQLLHAVHRASGGVSHVEVSAPNGAAFVHLEAPGARPDSGWFHLAPGQTRSIAVRSRGAEPPGGLFVRALSSATTVSVTTGTSAC
ncbi:glycosyl hydrolase 2 galactose-binding domain-containing protein [Agilicoccus flavus]|uniref:glycosyl hydrolase 2 galactose-binding domain-containing protein n=1 Tax=Agilicoccus flavus TaxID=2775968 RepID=UPI001CF6AE1E|nr:hypothetical protein [Agilicoccus flavus]